MALFDKYNQIEKQLLHNYTQTFSSMGIPNASKTAKDMLNKSIDDSKKQGTYNLPPTFGNTLLGRDKPKNFAIKKVAEIIRKTLLEKNKDGVTDQDITWWWNLNDVERAMMYAVDEMHRIALFIQSIEEGLAEDQAAAKVRKFHPMYGDPSDTEHTKGDDRPLPFELKDRINRYVEKMQTDANSFKAKIEASSTFNALVRKEIRSGNI